MRILFTGGAGSAGRQVIPELLKAGHHVTNFDLRPLQLAGVRDVIGDVTEAGQIATVLAGGVDAVVHFAAIARPLAVADNEMFRVNALGTQLVLETATRFGVRKVVLASSESIFGICYADGTMQPAHLPLDEDTAFTPMDSYGLSKAVNEATARAVQRRTGADIYCLRIAVVIAPADYAKFPADFVNPAPRRRGSFAYVDGRDLGRIVDLALRADGLGFQIFNAVNDTTCLPIPSMDLASRFFPGVALTRPLAEFESLLCTRKLKRILGFRQAHDWRDHVAENGAAGPSV